MKMKFRIVAGLMLTAVSALVFGSCVTDSDSSGLEYMPDMYRSPAIEPYVDYGEIKGREVDGLKDKLSAKTPPMGTIPYYGSCNEDVMVMLPWSVKPNIAFKETHGLKGFEFTSEDTYNTQALAWTENPLPMDIDVSVDADGKEVKTNLTLKEGKRLYAANCMHCHGEKGDGKGPMMTNGTFAGVPNYADKAGLSNGQLFYSIYYGKGAMGSHASIVNKKEIWTLVHYIRKFQDKDYDKAAMEAATVGGAAMPMPAHAAPVEEVTDWDHLDAAAMRNHHLKLNVLYTSGSASIDMAKSKADLDHVLNFMNANPDVKIELAGHTDNTGTHEVNAQVSQERAEAVKAWLVEHGIDASRMMAHGYGDSQLVMDEHGEVMHDASRRTELIIK